MLSVIIPCFNCADYIKQCIDSIDYDNVEIIAINDGSSDNTLEILQDFENKKENFVLINQKNQGASSARNAGLKVAKGEYVVFIDSDDFFEKNALKTAHEVAIKQDLDLFCSPINFYTNNEKKLVKKINSQKELINKDEYFSLFFDCKNKVLPSIQGNLYKTKIIQENQISFLNDIFIADDVNFNAKFAYFTNKILLVQNPLVNYRIGENNLSKSFKFQHFVDVKKAVDDLDNFFKNKQLSKEQNLILSSFFLMLKYEAALILKPFSFEDYEKSHNFALSDINTATSNLGFQALSNKLKILIYLRKICGFRLYVFLINLYYKLRKIK